MVTDVAPPAARSGADEASGGAASGASAMKALASGRFAEAAALNAGLLAENPDNRQAQLGYALAQVGLGQADLAAVRLRALALASDVPDPDVGLALALAGAPQEGVAILQRAATRPEAGPRVRQNLALALALADLWQDARRFVEHDTGQAQATRQLTRWAVLAALPPQDRLASFLGVVPVHSPTALAHAEPPLVTSASVTQPETMTPPAAMAIEAGAVSAIALGVTVQEPATTVPTARQVGGETPPRPETKSMGWVVQLAAVRHVENLEAGWASLQARHPDLLARYTPEVTRGPAWSRLSIGGFNGREDALAQCRALRLAGTECFVRQLPSGGGSLQAQAQALRKNTQRLAPADEPA